MHLIKTVILATGLTILPVISFSENTINYSKNSPAVFQVVQNQFILDRTTIKSASINKKKDGTFGGVIIEIKSSASKDFIQLTKHNVGKVLNLVVNNKIISSAKIYNALSTQFVINGISKKEAQSLIDALKK